MLEISVVADAGLSPCSMTMFSYFQLLTTLLPRFGSMA